VVCLWLDKIDEPELIASIYHKYRGSKVLIIYSNQTRDFPILDKNGVIIAKNPNQMISMAKIFANQKIKFIHKTLIITNYDKILNNYGKFFAKHNLNISKIVQTNFENCDLMSASDIKNSDAVTLVLRPQIPNFNFSSLANLLTFCRKFSIPLIPILIHCDDPQLKQMFDHANILHYDNFQNPFTILTDINNWIANKNQNKIYIRLFAKSVERDKYSLGI
jgi:putative ribosome biogenesis GTPase RsgA